VDRAAHRGGGGTHGASTAPEQEGERARPPQRRPLRGRHSERTNCASGALLGASYSRLLRGSPPVPLPIASNTLLCAHNGRRRLDGWLVGSGGCRSNSAAAGTSPLDAGGCGGYSGAARSSLLEPAAAGATSGPAALPYAPAATAMATRPSPLPPRLVDNPHAPPCPPCPPFPVPDSWSQHRGAWWVGWPWL
jgi:hypothetical protein